VHPRCQKVAGADRNSYKGGPPLTYIPLPSVGVSRPWGNVHCTQCTEDVQLTLQQA